MFQNGKAGNTSYFYGSGPGNVFFLTGSLAASEGSSFIEKVFCILSGFYPERSTKMQIKNRITSAIKVEKI